MKLLQGKPAVKGFFDPRTFSVQYVVADPESRRCVIIDPVLDFEEKSGSTATRSSDTLLEFVRQQNYTLEWILDTHPHADHFSGAGYLKEKTGIPIGTGEKVREVQKLWKKIYNLPAMFPTDGSQWDKLFSDGEAFKLGNCDAEVMLTQGHTLASIAFRIGDAAFIHDTLFQPDFGTARADFPGGDAHALWRSIQKILTLPDETRLFTGHDYMPHGREPEWESTVAQQKTSNIHLKEAKGEDDFVKRREARDKKHPMPKLILQSLQININGGRLPDPESDGRRYLKIPLNRLTEAAWDDESKKQ